ncbi:hypothetical protein GCM10010109_63760 [Actinoplanes campanulatus]|nr:hypothetical protein GCM10010109_63760 [Actinoplanes campanulatus]GID39778.1 hypothetical protein Aca09nite_62840 [Actinoplanes campanulatus]
MVPRLPQVRPPAGEDPQALRLDTARPDPSGRLSIRYLLRTLGWSAGDRVDHTAIGEIVVITRSPTGRATIGCRGELVIPAATRTLAGLGNGPFLLVAVPAQNILVVHSEASVTGLLTDYYAHLEAVDDG